MTGKIITIKLPLLLFAVIIAVTTITSCGSNEEKNEKPFIFLGEGYENGVFRSDNFDKDTIVTPKNIAVLYNEYNIETLFNGSYYLIHSKKSYTTSRYLSRLIQMKEGKQVAAKTFYDSKIDANKVIKLRDKLIIGLNSLRVNNYDSTFHQSSHQCRVVVLSDSLTPIVGKIFYSQKGHTYIESLMQISDSTFICSVASGEVEIDPYSHYQFKGCEDLSIVGSTYISKQYDYAIHNEWMNFSESDWGNDLSDEVLNKIRKQIIDGTEINISKIIHKEPVIPNDFVLVPGGHLKYKGNYYEDYKQHSVELDSFYVCIFELTQGEYDRVTGNLQERNYTWLAENSWYVDKGPIYNEVKGDSIPVRGDLRDFAVYCNKRSEMEGYDGFYEIEGNSIKIRFDGNGYRLITPYEWIYAAYGGSINKRERFLGGKKLSDVAWHSNNSENKPHPVGLKNPNIIGIYDMQGNAREILQGDTKHSVYVSMIGEYNESDWNYPQTYAPTYIYRVDKTDIRTWCYGTRIALVPRFINNSNLKIQYKY